MPRKGKRDPVAGEFIRRLRIGGGYSPEDLARAIREHGTAKGLDANRVSISGDTIRLVEKGHIPGPRVKFALSHYFQVRPGQIWKDDALPENENVFPQREAVA